MIQKLNNTETSLPKIKSLICACLISICLLSGCMKHESGSTSPAPAASPAPAQVDRASEAPEEIDPAILENRAFHEAPTLAAKVRAGELPPVAQRLPEHPLVIRPIHQIGRYGGEIRRALRSDVSEKTGLGKTLNDALMGYERPIANSIQLNLAESYHFEDEGRVAVFKIREGVRWSDGTPFTVDDMLFWYYDISFDDNARTDALPPAEWYIDGKPIRLEKIDDYTIRYSADDPMGMLLHVLCHEDFVAPKHYWAHLHPKYNPEANYDDFRSQVSDIRRCITPDAPTISAWAPSEWYKGQRLVFERNPYYWKVDTVGNQLPYVDKLAFTIMPEVEVIMLRFMNGELDLFGRYYQPTMLQTLRKEELQGHYKLHSSDPNPLSAIYFNWDVPDPALKEAFRNKDVRIAISISINREEISQILFNGDMVPGGYTFMPGNPYYTEKTLKRFAQYDPVKSGKLLDAAGYGDSDGDGWRELKNRERFEVTLDVGSNSAYLDSIELIQEYFQDIGIKTNLNIANEDIIYPRWINGQFEMTMWPFNGSTGTLDAPHYWGILRENSPNWHRKAASEGPEWLRESTRYLRIALASIDPEERKDAMEHVRELHTENIPAIGLGYIPNYWGSSTRLGNVADYMSSTQSVRGWARPVFHEQLFIKE